MSQTPRTTSRLAPHELWRGVHATAQSDAVGGALLLALTGGVFRARHMRWRRLNA